MPLDANTLCNLFSTDQAYEKYVQRLKDGERMPDEGFTLEADDTIVYNGLPVIKRQYVEATIEQIVASHDVAQLMLGVVSLFKYIQSICWGVPRKAVEAYLRKQNNYQLAMREKRTVKAPTLTATKPGQLYCIDLLDMGEAHKDMSHRYILNVMDAFSRYTVGLRAMTVKTELSTYTAFHSILNAHGGFRPKMILSDQGKEFNKIRTDQIGSGGKFIHTESHSPTANPVERSNQVLRRALSRMMVVKNTRAWRIHLPEIEEYMRNSYNSTIKARPSELFLLDDRENAKVVELSRKLVAKQLKRKEEHDHLTRHLVPDANVRVSLYAVFAHMRQLRKEGGTKNMHVLWTPGTYLVNRVKNTAARARLYTLKNRNGNPVVRANGATRWFSYGELQHVGDDAEDNFGDMNRVIALNKIEGRPTSDLRLDD